MNPRPGEERLTTSDLAEAGRREEEARRRGEPRGQEPRDHPGGARSQGERPEEFEPLLGAQLTDDLRRRWQGIQTGFVDQPRRSVEEADGLVAETIKRLAESFADERAKLENQWGRGDDVSTEDLRMSLRRYRSFFDRLLSM